MNAGCSRRLPELAEFRAVLAFGKWRLNVAVQIGISNFTRQMTEHRRVLLVLSDEKSPLLDSSFGGANDDYRRDNI
jgi:hypothetical protein